MALDWNIFFLVSRIKNETGVFVTIPPDDSRSDEIRLEGRKEGVVKAKEEILEIAKRMVSEILLSFCF